MTLLEKIQADIHEAMRAKDQLRLDTLRSIKAALERYRTDQQKPVDEAVEQKILTTLANQRLEAAKAFDAGGRKERVDQEFSELIIIESYMLQPATEEEMDAAVNIAFSNIDSPTMRDIGKAMKLAQAKLAGKRVDGKMLSEKVKAALLASQPKISD